MISIRILNTNDNQIKNISAKIFEGISELTEFHIANNELDEFKSGTLAGTPHLSVLNIENNQITSFPRTIFSEDHHPTELELWISGTQYS